MVFGNYKFIVKPVPLSQRKDVIDEEIGRVKMIQEKSKIDDLTRKDLFHQKRKLQKVTNQLNIYKVTNLLDPWVNNPLFKPQSKIKLP